MIITFAFSDYLISIFQGDLFGWNYMSENVISNDVLFFEVGFFLIFGAMLAEAVMFISWKPDRLGLFVEPVFGWTLIKKKEKFQPLSC